MEILAFLTGGTIGMRRSKNGKGVAPSGTLHELFAHEFPMDSNVHITAVKWSDKPSPHMTPQDMLQLTFDMERELARSDVHGAVVLHGTDLLAETSFFLDMALCSEKPVVTTGSMRHMEEAGYDGQRNLLNSIFACLAMPQSSEVLLQIADLLFTARDATKLDSLSIDPFIGQRRGHVGRIIGSEVELTQETRCRRPRLPFAVTALAEHVPLVTCYPGMTEPDLLRLSNFHSPRHLEGLVIEAFGAGNVPPGIVPALEAILHTGIPVVLTTRCVKGGVMPIYDYAGGAAQLLQLGAISAGNLSGTKAMLLLKAALGSGCPTEKLHDLFK